MKIAITGGTGFIGRHLARTLGYQGHEVVLVARGSDGRERLVSRLPHARLVRTSTMDREALARAFEGCNAVAHCAGINREIGGQTFQHVHVDGTENVAWAARRAVVTRLVLVSFLRARPDCGSGYHESKWQAEEIVRQSRIDYTILRPGILYGRGDHLLDHLSRSLYTTRFFASVGFKSQPVAPVAVEDAVRVLQASLTEGRLTNATVSLTGPERLSFSEVVRRVARALDRRVIVFPLPVTFHRSLARFFECVMKVPLISVAQVRMLAEGVADALPDSDSLPDDLVPARRFSTEQIRAGLPDARGFGFADLRCMSNTLGSHKS